MVEIQLRLVLILGLATLGCERTTDRVKPDLHDDAAPRNLTRNPAEDRTPSWSPDGLYVVAAVSDSDRDRALVIYDLEGNAVHRFAEGYDRVFQPAWSPDGRSIAYAARVREGAGAEIFVEAVPDLPIRREADLQDDEGPSP